MPTRRQLLILILSRLALVSLVSGAVLVTTVLEPPTVSFLRLFALVVFVLSGMYLLLWRYTDRPDELYYLQFFLDLLLVTLLVHASGVVNSPFTPFYVLIIVYASLIRERKGGTLALALSTIAYLGIAHLGYAGWLPGSRVDAPYSGVVYRTLWNVLGFVAVALLGSYLSERWQSARRELGAAQALHEHIVNSIRTGLMTLTPDGRIASLNRAAEEISGYQSEELLAKPLSEVFPPEVLTAIQNSDFESTSRPSRLEFWTENNEQQSVFLGMSCSPLAIDSGQQVGYILSFQDLTEIKTREEQLQLKEKMAAIGQVAAGLAHELRNPLGALSGSIQILRSELQPSGESARLIEIVLRECDRLNKTVGDFLIYAGPRPMKRQSVDVVPLLLDTVELCKNTPEFQTGHSIEVKAPASLHGKLDPDLIRQAVWNVIQNALRAMPNGGKLAVSATVNESSLGLRFADEGVGMNDEDKRRLFEPFHSGFKKGVGLGMAIVYQIVQQHAGRIEVESAPGVGTQILITLPGDWRSA